MVASIEVDALFLRRPFDVMPIQFASDRSARKLAFRGRFVARQKPKMR